MELISVSEVETKVCVWCKVEKPVSAFNKYSANNPRNNAYYRPYCKECRNAYNTRPERRKAKKLCRGCNKSLSKYEFNVNPHHQYGLNNLCRSCSKANTLAGKVVAIDQLLRDRAKEKPP